MRGGGVMFLLSSFLLILLTCESVNARSLGESHYITVVIPSDRRIFPPSPFLLHPNSLSPGRAAVGLGNVRRLRGNRSGRASLEAAIKELLALMRNGGSNPGNSFPGFPRTAGKRARVATPVTNYGPNPLHKVLNFLSNQNWAESVIGLNAKPKYTKIIDSPVVERVRTEGTRFSKNPNSYLIS